MRIPFVGGSSQARSVNANAERSVNCFLELSPDNPPRPLALYGTPGLILRSSSLGNGGVRGAVVLNNTYCYWVAGNTVFRMGTDYAVTSCGTIGTTSGRVAMPVNAAGEVLVLDGAAGYIISGVTLTVIADTDFPDTVTSGDYLDGFFIVAGDGSRRLAWNEAADVGTGWDGTDFASAESSPEAVLGAYVDHRDVFVFKRKLVEVWQNTGGDPLFARSGNTVMQQGTAAFPTVQAMNNTLYWLGAGKNGQGVVLSAQGYNPIRISDHALETIIAGYSTIADAFGFCFEIAGHAFYALTFPTADATWLYDAATQKWYEWAWRDPETNLLHRHRANCCIFFNDEHLVGDWETGKVYGLSMDVYDDADDPILRLRRTQTLSGGASKLFFGPMTVDMETGVGLTSGQGSDPQVMMRYSDDGGHEWSPYLTCELGAIGETDVQVKFGPTGSGRNRVWELSMTDPVPFSVFGADVDVVKGS